MAVAPERPYAQFKFVVSFGGTSRGPHAGFREITGISQGKTTDVTLRHGVIGSSGFQQWLTDIRAAGQNAVRDVTIQMQSENRTVLGTWKLLRARIVKHTSAPLNAKGADVAMEELVLAYDRLEATE